MNPPSGNLVMRVQVLEDALGIYTDEHNQHAKATVAVDVDGDGEADYIVSGVDKDGDGIPDALQVHPPSDTPPKFSVKCLSFASH